jgi:hypothetical protein
MGHHPTTPTLHNLGAISDCLMFYIMIFLGTLLLWSITAHSENIR